MTIKRLPIHAIFLCCVAVIMQAQADEKPLSFEADIRQVLTVKCGNCHSDNVQKGGLDLSSVAGIRRGGESGEAAVASKVEDSLLWTMIDGGDMPPAGQPSLTADERDLIRRWIYAGSPSEQPAEKVVTQHDVLPIVLLRCITCHGARLKQGGVDLRTSASMRLGGKNGPALVPGNPDASLLIQRIESEACPPRELLLKFFVKRPPQSEIKVLRDWIRAGAVESDIHPDVTSKQPDPSVTDEDRQHWAFRPPMKTENATSIDDFVRAKLVGNGLDLSPEADRDTLIRRAYFDLIGIPPRLAEWKKWRTSANPNWYQAMIDHLLDLPHYGERWGRYYGTQRTVSEIETRRQRGSDRSITSTLSRSVRYGPKRIIFGSHLPSRSLGTELGKVIGAEISERDTKLILGENFRSLLRPILKMSPG